jgi:catechol 2,3-dioxygenase-like lactoylglutathione lyase family enzyme
MFAYICLGSNDLRRSAKFYDAALGVLGYSRCDTSAESETSWNGWVGWGLYEKDGAVQDALWVCTPFNGAPAAAGNGAMVALWAKTWAQVDAFHAAALAHGGTSDGAPVCACNTTRTSTRPMFAIRMAINSRRFAAVSLLRTRRKRFTAGCHRFIVPCRCLTGFRLTFIIWKIKGSP